MQFCGIKQNDMEKTLIQLIKAVASKLHNSKLKRLGGKEMVLSLNCLKELLGLDNTEEVIIFTALFDRSCSGRSCDIDDIASYFDCTQLDIMEYVPVIKSLLKKGFIVQTNLSECRIARQDYLVTNYVINCILENIKPEYRKARMLDKEFDRYDFCKLVDSQIQDSDVTAETLFQFIETLEQDNHEMQIIKDLKNTITDIQSRTLFYEVCFDFFNQNGDGRSSLNRTLSDMYEVFGLQFRERKLLVEGTHPLIKADLIELSGDNSDIFLTDRGKHLFLGDDYGAFGQQYSELNPYSFARKVKDYIYSRDHDIEKKQALPKLAIRIRNMENYNYNLTCIRKIKELVSEEDYRALFYILCDACANSDIINISRELARLYLIKERNENIKLFKEEKHKLQRLDLVEMVTMSSLFGEYTGLQLTDKGKFLYFEEDAELFIEKVDRKDLILSSEIKEKKLFFSGRESEQLSLVGETLSEVNYKSLVDRLELKGLPKGISILLYGNPGTGKTESVMQWARETGRDIIHVDISVSKSMWYGESEKIVKDIFNRYRKLCKRSKLKPILLFNEADAIFSKRRDISSGNSVDQTENTIQNILLEEMEKLEGILIATTNLSDNLDKAFERRFLFKIHFSKPSVEVKCNIWLNKMPALNHNDAMQLASLYDFSGGEIDNVVRKYTMMEIIDGKTPSFETIQKLCNEEKINLPYNKIGFARY